MMTRKVKRSNVYHLLNTIVPTNHKLKAELDVIGSIIILAVGVGIAILFSIH